MSARPHVVVVEPYNAGLALARRMVRAGAEVTVIVEPGETLIAHSRGVRGVVAPFEPNGVPWLTVLRDIAARADEVVVLPCTDRAAEMLAHEGPSLPAAIRAFERRGEAHLALMDKQRADAIARRAGVPVPWTATVSTPAELEAAAAQAPWPCVVKPTLSHEWRARHGAKRAFLAHDADEAAEIVHRGLRDGLGMLLSQYIPGGDDDVEEAIVVRLADGSYPVAFGCRKLRQHPTGFGMTSVGESSPLPETTAIARRVLDEAGFIGVAGVEAKRHAETGERWFLEVNVRVPGQWGLGDASGVDASPRLVAALLARPLGPQPPLRAGRRVVFPELDIHVVGPALRAAAPRDRPRLAAELAGAYVNTREVGMFDPRDPAVLGAFLARMVARRLRRGSARG